LPDFDADFLHTTIRIALRPSVAYWCVLCMAVLIVAELGSLATLSLLHKRWITYADFPALHTQQNGETLTLPDGSNTDSQSFFGGVPTYLHPYLGFTLKPRTEVVGGGRSIALEAFGFFPASGEIVLQKEESEIVVGILGGSLAQNFIIGGNGGKALAETLLKDPRFAGKHIRFTSMASGGYKEPQHLLALNYFLSLGAQFDIVINLSGFNEVTLPFRENIPAGLHPLYPRSWQLLAGGLSHEKLSVIGRIAMLRDSQQRNTLYASWHPCDWSAACTLTFFVRGRYIHQQIHRLNADLILHTVPNNTSPIFAGPPMGRSGTGSALREIVATWKNSAMLIEDLGRSRGFRTFTFLQPSPYIGGKPLSAQERAILEFGGWSDRYSKQGYPALQEAVRSLREEGYTATDLSNVFSVHPETLYVDSCCHVGAEGDRILAKAMGRGILRDW